MPERTKMFKWKLETGRCFVKLTVGVRIRNDEVSVKAFQPEHLEGWFVTTWDEDKCRSTGQNPSGYGRIQAICFKDFHLMKSVYIQVFGEKFQNNDKVITRKIQEDCKVDLLHKRTTTICRIPCTQIINNVVLRSLKITWPNSEVLDNPRGTI